MLKGLFVGEECDNGLSNSNSERDACRLNCRNHFCGDGVWDSGEQCDPGYGPNSGVCSLNCTCLVASRRTDNGEGNPCLCGNGITDPGEECDGGVAGNNNKVKDACRTNCVRAHCGDGVVDTGEQCDSGTLNANTANRCRATCRLPLCGDGIVDSGEECDDGPNNNNTAPSACRLSCLRPFCGDGVKDTFELCDEGENNSDEVPGACKTDCLSRVPEKKEGKSLWEQILEPWTWPFFVAWGIVLGVVILLLIAIATGIWCACRRAKY